MRTEIQGFFMSRELQTINQQSKLTLQAGRIMEGRIVFVIIHPVCLTMPNPIDDSRCP